MPATARQKVGHVITTGDNGSVELPYVVTGTNDLNEAQRAIADDAPAVNGYSFDYARADELYDGSAAADGLWEGAAVYRRSTFGTVDAGDEAFSFNTTGGTQHITQSKSTTKIYYTGGGTPDFGGAIGVQVKDGKVDVEGCDVVIPQFEFEQTKTFTSDAVTPAFVGAIYALTGRTNSAPILTKIGRLEAGECLFLGASGQQRGNGNWDITFRFAANPNVTAGENALGQPTGGLVIGSFHVSKKGWEYVWVQYVENEDTTNKTLVAKPYLVGVEKVYDEGDFTALGIFKSPAQQR